MKYKINDRFVHKDVPFEAKVLMAAPSIDYQDKQWYFCEVVWTEDLLLYKPIEEHILDTEFKQIGE